MKRIIENLEKIGSSFVTGILIDEFSPKNLILDEAAFIKRILNYNVPVDFIAYESKLKSAADKIIKEIPKAKLVERMFGGRKVLLLSNTGKQIGLKEGNSKYTCALLIAAWILIRLGLVKPERGTIKHLTKKQLSANKLITILPEKYRESESKVLEILRATKFKSAIKDIDYVFF